MPAICHACKIRSIERSEEVVPDVPPDVLSEQRTHFIGGAIVKTGQDSRVVDLACHVLEAIVAAGWSR